MAFFAFEPLIFFLSNLVFLVLPLSIFFIKWGLNLRTSDVPNIDNKNSRTSDVPILILLPFLWTLFDHLQARYSLLPTYIATAGNIFGSSPFLGLAAIGGLTGLTFFTALVNVLFALIILQFLRSRTSRNYTMLGGLTSLILILIFGTYLFSKIQLQKNASIYQNLPNKINVALISIDRNFAQEFRFFKYDILSLEENIIAKTIIEGKMNLIKNELYGKKIDLVILPEDMINIESWKDAEAEAKNKFGIENAGILIGAYRELAREFNANLAATITTIQNNKRYNSTILFNRQGELVDIYNKFNLAITGEYWPFGDWQPFYYKFIKKDMLEADQGRAIFDKEYVYQRGQEKILRTENLIFGSAICSEIQYPWQIKILKKWELNSFLIRLPIAG